jgi:SAM-dependent methyltransferase
MLRYAKKNAPDAKFILGDARNFRLPTVYDAVFSTFNALNHVMTLEELRQVFRNVIGCLVSGGIFIFDLNMEKEFETQWRTLNRTNERPDYTYSVRGDYNKKRQLAKLHCTICRRKAKSWKCSNITLLETCYSQAKVRSALKKAGFTNIRARTFDRQLRLDKAADAVNMMCFFAQKPRRPGDTRFCGRSVCPPAIL